MTQARACLTISDIKVGDTFEKTFTISDEMTQKFSEVTGDYNPVHHDDAFAKKTIFRRRIAHGMLTLSQFSGIFGMDLPGLGVVWLSQSAEFLAPVYLDEEHIAKVTANTVDTENGSVTFKCECFNSAGKLTMQGEGILKPIPEKTKKRMGL